MTRPLRLILTLALAAAFVVRLVVVLGAEGPIAFADEFIYLSNTRTMLGGGEPYLLQYPPLYSVVLMPALMLGEHFYVGLLVINVLVSSLMLVPIWLLARRMVSADWALCLLLAASLLPVHFVYGQLILSESLFTTLFLFAVYFFLRLLEEKRAWISVACGVSLACCLLTRYFTVLLPPVLVVLWVGCAVVAVRRRQESWIPWVTHAALVFVAGAIAWSPWLIAGLVKGWSIGRLLGVSARTVAPERDPALGLPGWVTLYGFYFILMVAPVLVLVVLNVVRSLRRRQWLGDERERAFTILLWLSTGIYLVISAHHSWRSPYNAELPQYILGRYLMHLAPLWLIRGFAILARITRTPATSSSGCTYGELVTATILTFGLLLVSDRGLIQGEYFEISSWMVMFHNGIDAFVFRTGTGVAIGVGVVSIVLLMLIRWAPRTARGFFLTGVCVFLFFSSRLTEEGIPSNGQHGREIARVVREHDLLGAGRPHLFLVDGLKTYPYSTFSLTFALRFWGLDPERFTIVDAAPEESSSSVLLYSDESLTDPQSELVGRYGYLFYLYLRRGAPEVE